MGVVIPPFSLIPAFPAPRPLRDTATSRTKHLDFGCNSRGWKSSVHRDCLGNLEAEIPSSRTLGNYANWPLAFRPSQSLWTTTGTPLPLFCTEMKPSCVSAWRGVGDASYGDLTTNSPTVISEKPLAVSRYLARGVQITVFLKMNVVCLTIIVGEIVAKSPYKCLQLPFQGSFLTSCRKEAEASSLFVTTITMCVYVYVYVYIYIYREREREITCIFPYGQFSN